MHVHVSASQWCRPSVVPTSQMKAANNTFKRVVYLLAIDFYHGYKDWEDFVLSSTGETWADLAGEGRAAGGVWCVGQVKHGESRY